MRMDTYGAMDIGGAFGDRPHAGKAGKPGTDRQEVPDALRAPLARLLKRAAPRQKVLAHSEIPETHSIRIGSIIGATS